VSLPVEVGPNAQRVLSKHAERNSSSKFDSAGGSGVKIGDNCKNNACKAVTFIFGFRRIIFYSDI
jgi:hypothetical protein